MKRIFHLNNYVRTYSALARARKTLSPGERDVSSYSARAFPPGKPVRFSPRRKSVRLTAVFGTPKKAKGKNVSEKTACFLVFRAQPQAGKRGAHFRRAHKCGTCFFRLLFLYLVFRLVSRGVFASPKARGRTTNAAARKNKL